jgi:predicted ATPase
MLNHISVDGFKSFKDFSIELKRGLNVIAGPNGSGKTNIIKFVEFLAYLGGSSLVEAVSRAGGAGSIFRQTSKDAISSQISFEIRGETKSHSHREKDASKLLYTYAAVIEFSLEDNLVYFSSQSITIELLPISKTKTLGRGSSKSDILDMTWDFESVGDGKISVRRLDGVFRNSPVFGTKAGKKSIEIFFQKEMASSFKERSLLFMFRPFVEHVDAVAADVTAGRSYNIDPNVVRQSEDIAGEPGIKWNGGGLAATLNAAKAASRPVTSFDYAYRYVLWQRGPQYEKKLISEVANYARLINSDILDIEVESDPVENRLRVFLKLSYDNSQLRFPLSLASDGTVKWLALVSAVLTNRSIVAVEEPENFLHPYMQCEFVNIIRASCEKSKLPTFAIITTHSETLINSVFPEELIVFSMESGATRAVRPQNARMWPSTKNAVVIQPLRIKNSRPDLSYVHFAAGCVQRSLNRRTSLIGPRC